MKYYFLSPNVSYHFRETSKTKGKKRSQSKQRIQTLCDGEEKKMEANYYANIRRKLYVLVLCKIRNMKIKKKRGKKIKKNKNVALYRLSVGFKK